MNSCAVNVGRLVEIKAAAGYRTIADTDAIFAQIARATAKLPRNQGLVIVTDWRECPIMSDESSTRMVEMITRSNPRVERSAAIASTKSPAAVLQFVRLIRESKLPDRRLFNDPEELITWLSEVLNPAETERLRVFLNCPEPKG